MATQTAGTKLTIISGYLRGRRCIHQVDVFDKVKESPYLEHAFRLPLVEDDGGSLLWLGCQQVKSGR